MRKLNEGQRGLALMGALCLLAGCSAQTTPTPQLSCGEGTTRDGARCIGIPAITCATGTRLENGSCISAIDPVTCAGGTHLEAGQCVLDATSCGEGTELKDGKCIVVVVTPPPTRWLPNVRVCPMGATCYDPVMAVGADRHVYVAYTTGNNSSISVGVAVSSDDGATFTQKSTLTVSSRYALVPDLVAGDDGTLYLVYDEYEPDPNGQSDGTGNIWFARSTDRGATWLPPVAITAPSEELDYQPFITKSGGDLLVLWMHYSANGSQPLVSKSTDQGATWSTPVAVPGDPGSYGQFQFAHGLTPQPDGTYALPFQSVGIDFQAQAYVSNAGVMTVSLDPMMTTVNATQVNLKKLNYDRSNSLDAVATVAVNPAGSRCAVFVDAPSRDYTLYGVFGADPLTSSTRPRALDLGPGQQLAPSVAIAENGDCHLTWLDNRTGEWALHSAVIGADGTVKRSELVSDRTFIEDTSHPLSTRADVKLVNGVRYAVWNDTRDDDQSVYFSRGPLQ